MIRFFRLFAVLALVLSIATGSIAHAAEGIACGPQTEAVAGHVDGDADQVPGDSDKGYPHHHGGCHGHHVAAPADAAIGSVATRADGSVGRARHARLMGTPIDPALRPPQA